MTEAVQKSLEVTSAHPTLSDLKPKMRLTGRVTKVELFGALVDVGLGQEGLIHISQLGAAPVNRVEDVLKAGQAITAWVRKVDARAGRLDLTLIEPLGLEWNDIRKGMAVQGKVVRVEKFGAFVDIGAERPGLVHVSELAEGYVNEPGQLINVGDEVEALVAGVDRKKKRIDLSLKALQQKENEAPEEEEASVPTAFEVALRSAMKASDSEPSVASGSQGGANKQAGDKSEGKGRGHQRARRREAEEIFARTLKQHASQK